MSLTMPKLFLFPLQNANYSIANTITVYYHFKIGFISSDLVCVQRSLSTFY